MALLAGRASSFWIIGWITLILPSLCWGECSHKDVEFYLSKGFTTAQITALCTAAPPSETHTPAPTSEQAEDSSLSDTTPTSPQAAVVTQDDGHELLKTAIEGYDISLSESALHYTRKLCIEYGEEDLFGFTPKVCANIRSMIGFNDLDVQKAHRKYLIYGPRQIKVKGHIEHEIVGDLEPKHPDARQAILNKIDTGDETDIPIREGIPIERVEATLKKLVI
ncbi:MAG: hypothetical protein GY807_21370 [Gammaproteobacteria bacterium]|nr:hypothetical protein [Gammaproteobacteria bacterium]